MYYNGLGLSREEKAKQKEEKILEVIKDYWIKHSYSPTIREISKKTSIPSTSTVLKYLNRLQEKGIIDWQQKMPRTIHIINQKESSAS